jgi:hypothetical protein
MGLDEVTQICPVPLPAWLSDSGGKGIQVVAVVHGEAQLAGRWGDHGRQVVLDTSSVKAFLPGITDTTTLEAASTLCGDASWKTRGQDHRDRQPVATPDMIRQLPAGTALVIRGGNAPVIARLPRAWNNHAYRRARRRARIQAPAVPPTPRDDRWPDPEPQPEPTLILTPGPWPGQGPGLRPETALSRPPRLGPRPAPGENQGFAAGPGGGPVPPFPGFPNPVISNGPSFPWQRR